MQQPLDIDERQPAALAAAAAALRSSEEKYRLIVENVSEGILVVQDGRIVLANRQAAGLSGRTLEELYQISFADAVWPEDRAYVFDRYQRRIQGREVERRYSFRLRHRDGHPVWVELSAVRVEWEGRPATLSFVSDISSRKQAEETLRRSEENARSLIERAPLGIVIVRNNRICLANRAMLNMLGYALEEMVQAASILEFVFPDDRAMIAAVARSQADSGHTDHGKAALRVVRKDGKVRWAETTSVQVLWEDKAATLTFVQDITERRSLQEKLLRSLEQRDTMLDNSIVSIVFLSYEGRARWANRAAEQMFGVKREAMVGGSIEPFYASREEYAATGAAVSQAVRAGRTYEAELRMRRRSGELFWVQLSGKAVSSRDLSKGTVWVLMDITARKKLEETLLRTSAEREAMLNSTLVGVMMAVDRRIVWSNRRGAELVGYAREALPGRSSRDWYPDDATWERFGAATRAKIAADGFYSGETQIRRPDGSPAWLELHAVPIDRADLGKGIIWTLVDITRSHEAQQSMREALAKQKELSDLKSRFVSMASHEFRTPLAAIMSSAELLRDYGERLPAEERQELIGIVTGAVRRMSAILDDVLTIGKAEADKLDYSPAPLDLPQLCAALVRDAEQAAEAAGLVRVPVRLVCSGRDATARLDESLVRHILGNLISNALKYSLGRGEVIVEAHCSDTEARFTVTDHGIGIPEEDIARLFHTFHRGRNVGSIGGTGLGMAIVKRAADRHGGRVEVHSRLNAGTRITVTLPQG